MAVAARGPSGHRAARRRRTGCGWPRAVRRASTSSPGAQRVAVLEQQPARALDDAAAAAIAAQLVGAIDPHPVDDLAAVLGHDVEQVEDDGGVGTVPTNLKLVARVQYPSPPRATAGSVQDRATRRTDGRPRGLRPRPTQTTRAIEPDGHRCIVMNVLAREFVRGEDFDPIEFDGRRTPQG